LPSPSISKSPCLPCSDDSGSLNYISTLQDPFSIAYPSNSTTLESIVFLSVTTNSHHMITRGKAGIFKPQSHHALIVLSSSWFFQALLAIKEPRGFSLLQNNLNGSQSWMMRFRL